MQRSYEYGPITETDMVPYAALLDHAFAENPTAQQDTTWQTAVGVGKLPGGARRRADCGGDGHAADGPMVWRPQRPDERHHRGGRRAGVPG